MTDPQPRPKPLAATKLMKQIMADHFLALDAAAADPQRKVAWCTSVGPAELLRGFGFEVYFPENHSAILGASRQATDFIPRANAIGYSPEICSYLTADIGAFLQGFTPLTKAYGIGSVPKPDVLVYNTNQCRDVQDWLMWYARHWQVPCIGVHTHRNVGVVGKEHIASIAAQLRGLVPRLEQVAGRPLDMELFRQAVRLSRRCSELWEQVLRTGTARPSPLTFFDGTIQMGPAVVLRGTQAAVDYYTALLAELQERVAGKVAAVPDERFRIYWDGMPIWGKLRALSEQLEQLRTCAVASTYCNSWIFGQLDPDEPFESMARAYTELFIVRADPIKEDYIARMCAEYGADGIIFHDARTCPNNSNDRYGMPRRLQERLGLPHVVIDGDLNDLRCYSEEQARTRIEAFVEQLAQ
ncbi:MAG: 2-hydroxyacyl-CoA dehydratase, partial [Deltaproteobacteria bacterium]|nr:2-hydroxyacyl-CoA dehydratase [Deltaproteobacteria bacterium]